MNHLLEKAGFLRTYMSPLWLIKARTALSLGVPNLVRAVGYRLGVRLGMNPVRKLQGEVLAGPYFGPSAMPAVAVPPVSAWQDTGYLFSCWPVQLEDEPPNWLANPLTGQQMSSPHRPWWQIPDFDPVVGDIKLMWELSRMDWVMAFAQRIRNGDARTLVRLNAWMGDWCAQNPPYLGPNWKCGQEASIRVMHLACAALVLGQVHTVLPDLRRLLELHVQRIAPTVQYAMAQDNNHGTSEAAALFIGGSWLAKLGDARGEGWSAKGRMLLENRAARLIGEQGTFSQYSLNYHRVMLDSMCLVEVWRRYLGLPMLSSLWCARMRSAAYWLYTLIDPDTGDGPNVGANDGARLLQLTRSVYRDYRPTVQLALALFADERAYGAVGTWNDSLHWLDVPLPTQNARAPGHLLADDGGFAVMRRGLSMVLMRYPRFRFRPSQADALHLDFWRSGINLLRDAGTYSYNSTAEDLAYFGGTRAHNTVEFDGRDQMPRISRFLFGQWLRSRDVEVISDHGEVVTVAAGYRDSCGAEHHRSIELRAGLLICRDRLGGTANEAMLRWRLAPGDWFLAGTVVVNRVLGVRLQVIADQAPLSVQLVEGWESRHYLEKTPLLVLEIRLSVPAVVTTEIHF